MPSDRSSSGTSHVGPILFGHETARSQLIDEGEVVTFRESQRTTGSTWWRESRTGPKKGDVQVDEIGKVDLREDRDVLAEYADKSGFGTTEDWIEAIRNLNGSPTYSGYLYRVTSLNPRHLRAETDGGGCSDAEDFERLIERIHGQWNTPDPDVLAIDHPKEPVVADVDGDLRLYHGGLVAPISTSLGEVAWHVSEYGGRVESLSDHADRFDKDLFEWEVNRDAE